MKPGVARVAGHLGELVQGRLGDGGPVALVTLPCPALTAEATFSPDARGSIVASMPLAGRAASVAAQAIGRGDLSGSVRMATAMPPGGGAGSSTACALAAMRAVSASAGAALSPETESALLLEVEGAVDPLAFPPHPPRLWASRRAETIETLPPLPPLWVAGAFDGPSLRTDPEDDAFPDMSEAFDRLRRALAVGDPAALGAAATLSARANQTRNPKPRWGAAEALAAEKGALGVAVAHTGSAVALLFGAEGEARARSAATALGDAGLERPVVFALAADGADVRLAGSESASRGS